MLYRFRSSAGADVVMLGDAAEVLLRLLGREPAAQGIFQNADLPALVQRLEQAVTDDDAQFQRAVDAAQAAGEPRRAAVVSLRQRAWPLRELMLHSQRERADVVWGV
jgi:hypothetical protein